MRYLLLLLPFVVQAQIPTSYFDELSARAERNYILMHEDSVDVVLDPISQIPMPVSYNTIPSNPGKDFYKVTYTEPKNQAIIFILDTGGSYKGTKDLEPYSREDLARTFTGEAPQDLNGHSTHCAGIIVSPKSGVLHDYAREGCVSVVPYKVLRNNGTGSSVHIVNGINAVTQIAPDLIRQGYIVGVNLSLGASGRNTAFEQAIKKLEATGAIIAVATGNNGVSTIGTPANSPGALAIGSIGKNLKRSWFSNYGEVLYMMGFGEEVNSTFLNNTYAVLQGTSMATPNTLAILILRAMLTSKAEAVIPKPVIDLGKVGYDTEYGNGIFGEKEPPVNDTLTTYTIPIKEKYLVKVGPSIFETRDMFITHIQLTYTSKEPSNVAVEKVMLATRKFFGARGFVTRPGDDLDEDGGIAWFFYVMLLKQEGIEVKVDYVDVETAEGYPLRILKPFTNSLSSLAQGVIMYEYK